jgi:hypothetical protein
MDRPVLWASPRTRPAYAFHRISSAAQRGSVKAAKALRVSPATLRTSAAPAKDRLRRPGGLSP